MEHGHLSGMMFGKYHLQYLLGMGGMGVVYVAHQTDLDRIVAFKVLNTIRMPTQIEVDRFLREARIAAGLEHPHIVPVYDFGIEKSNHYLVMRLMHGGSLDMRIEQSLMTPIETAKLLGQIASALDYAHQQGVIHRDIKPNNVLFDQHDVPYLSDFGIAKLLDDTNRLTTTNQVIGTPVFMAPELWRSEQPTPASDIYALGVLIYHALTGRLPFEASNPYHLMVKHLRENPIPLTVANPTLPAGLQAVLEKTLDKDPTQRYAHARAFSEAFEAVICEGSAEVTPAQNSDGTAIRLTTAPTTRPVIGTQRKRRLWRVNVIVVGVLFIAALIFLWQSNRNLASDLLVGMVTEESASVTPPPTSTRTPRPTFTLTHTSSPTLTDTPQPTSTHTPSPTFTYTSQPTLTRTPRPSPTFTYTPLPTLVIGPVFPSTQTAQGQLTAQQNAAVHYYQWTAGQVVSICLESTDFDAYLILTDPNGHITTYDDFGGTKNACTSRYLVTTSGDYQVVVTSFDRTSTGSYDYHVTDFDACAASAPLGQVISGNTVNLRDRPSIEGNVIGLLAPQECFTIIDQNGNWWKIRTPDNREGWVIGGAITVIGSLP